jgi:sugar phosphate isomerase/epimerase
MKPGSRPQYYRIRRMVQMVREGAETGYLPNSSDFMREFEVSRRTVARDLDFLRDEERAPLAYDDARHGFRLTDETYTLPPVTISRKDFRRAMDTFDSPMHGLDFCHGCWSEMRGGEGVVDAIRYFGERGKILYVHFRDVQGTVEDFTECHLDDGNCDPVETIRTLKQIGFNGFLFPDHVPRMVDDTDWCHRGRAWAVGYIKALIDGVQP